MDTEEFRQRGREMLDYIIEYLESISERNLAHHVEPGYLRKLLPDSAPEKGEGWSKIFQDFKTCILPGITHTQHPRFHACFPSSGSYASILADMLSAGMGCIGFSWASNPACTELETIVLDWLGQMIGLPDAFLRYADGSRGGGVLQVTASDAMTVTLLAARHAAIKAINRQNPNVDKRTAVSSLIAYCSKEAHPGIEKAAMIGLVKIRVLETDDKYRLTASTLERAMAEDKSKRLVPFFVFATLGTNSCCSCDPIEELGLICEKYEVWFHVEAAYAGSALICPEYQHLLTGIEYANSFSTNPTKWMMMNFDGATMWIKDRFKFTESLFIDPLYLRHSYSNLAVDYRHWGVPLSRRFRALKLWFVIRNFGVNRLQQIIRHHYCLGKLFEILVQEDKRFTLMNDVSFGLACFRLKGPNILNEKLVYEINSSDKLHIKGIHLKEKYVIRFCTSSERTTEDDIRYDWNTIVEFANKLLLKEEEANSVMYSEHIKEMLLSK